MAHISIQSEDFDPGAEIAALGAAGPAAGAQACFVGVVRSDAARPIEALILEHYPGMTEAEVGRIAEEAEARFGLLGCRVVHRFGRMAPGDRIVFVGAAAGHRQAALDAVGFLMDWLKTAAPFWKQEVLAGGETRWVEALAADDAAAAKWEE